MAQLLLDTMTREYASLDEHLSAYFDILDASIKKNADQQIEFRKNRAKHAINPILSCFVNDCLQKGADIERGGARYNWIMPSFVGMANLVDALFALKTLVYDSHELTVLGFKKILDENYESAPELRAKIASLPKYGNDIDEVDKYFELISTHIIDECKKHVGVHSNSNFIPSVFCWIMHEQFGSKTAATPDGRVAGFPLGDGSGPCQGREMCGPTASIISSTKWEHDKMIGGVAGNMKFAKSSLGPSSIDTMCSVIKTYLERGGFEMQINVVDKDTLIAARKNPEMYRDLVVRIGGYSDYFTKLSPAMQDEVILRTSHSI
jgi:formate C-acetyltransferase